MYTMLYRFAEELNRIEWPAFNPEVSKALIPFIEAVEKAKAEKNTVTR